MDRFTRDNLRPLDAELAAALRPICEQYGISVRAAGATFSDTRALVKFELVIQATASPEAAAAVAAEFARYAAMVGVRPDALGKSFTTRTGTYTVTGINPGRSSFPVSATRSDGKAYKFPAQALPAELRAAP